MKITELTEHIKQLELKLLHTNVHGDTASREALVSPEFEEIDGEGKLSTRQSVIESLKSTDHSTRWQLEEFSIKGM